MLNGMTDWADMGHSSVDFLELLNRGSADDDADSRLESVAFACLANGLTDARAAAILGVLGFNDDFLCFAVGGTPLHTVAGTRAALHKTVRDLGGGPCVTGTLGGLCIAMIAPRAAVTPDVTCTNAMPAFDKKAPVCLSPLRRGVVGASRTIRAVATSIAAAPALSKVPRPMRADDVLPERALLGDEDAADELVDTVYASLTASGPEDPTLETVSAFLGNGGSLETCAKELSVHPNTVRYRLKRAAETTGWDATDAREAYVLRTAIALGRMRHAAAQDSPSRH